MGRNNKNKEKGYDFDSLVENVDIDNLISIDSVLKDNYPIFCFKYLSDISIKDCEDSRFFIEFLTRLKKLSELGWDEIRKSGRHSYGMEQIPVKNIKPSIPACVTKEVKNLHVFRATGDNRPFVGLQVGRVFRVFFIETNFGDIYDHN